jgi:predicted methyltransferase
MPCRFGLPLKRSGDARRRFAVPAWIGLSMLACILPLCGPAVVSAQRETAEQAAVEGAVQKEASAPKQKAAEAPAKPKNREESLHALVEHLGVDKGAVIADVGAGRGNDSWVFAEIVGKDGKVYSEEIGEGTVDSLKEQAEKKELTQVEAILGETDDPKLPKASADMAYMHLVYHHLSKPREMLRGIRDGLKPGWYFVVVDRALGTLQEWVPREARQNKHYWIAETTVVREAREEGFEFVECAEQLWHEKDTFVLVFRRPQQARPGGGDPDAPLPLAQDAADLLLPIRGKYERPVFIALGEARQMIAPILHSASGPGLEIVLEEWATQKDERPPLPEGVSLPSVLTEKGDPRLGPEPIDAVFFLDTYNLLFHGETLLAKLHERLAPGGCVYVLDRRAKGELSRRQSSHRRQIAPQTVKKEMAAAGFSLWFEGPRPAPDRFLLVFGKTEAGQLPADADPMIGGPRLPAPPQQWLKANAWRLRGLRTEGGELIKLDGQAKRPRIEQAGQGGAGRQIWQIGADGPRVALELEDGAWTVVGADAPR